jgi:hypothetical protein
MTKDELLARVANAYDCGLLSDVRLSLLARWLDFVMRLEGGQIHYAVDFLADEAKRLDRFGRGKTLAGDADGYALILFAAILTHQCQTCATSPNAWWTRGCFGHNETR